MEALAAPWADLALLLRQTVGRADSETGSSLPVCLLALVLFLSVCLLLLQLLIYLSWKLRQVEAEIVAQNRNAIYGPLHRSAPARSRSAGSHSHT